MALMALAGCEVGKNLDLSCADWTGPSSSGSSSYSAPPATPTPSGDIVISMVATPTAVEATTPFAIGFRIRFPPGQTGNWSLACNSTQGTRCSEPKTGDVANGSLDGRVSCEAGGPEDVISYLVVLRSNPPARDSAALTVAIR